MNERHDLALVCRVLAHVCALPLAHVEETMRVLAIEPLAGLPHFVRGLAVIRGAPTPVVDAAALLSLGEAHPTRFVTIKTGTRRVALAVDAVLGIREIPVDAPQELPPLLNESNAGVISAIGILDAALLIVLQSARLVPEDVWARLEADGLSR